MDCEICGDALKPDQITEEEPVAPYLHISKRDTVVNICEGEECRHAATVLAHRENDWDGLIIRPDAPEADPRDSPFPS